MLNSAVRNQVKGGFDKVIDLLGTELVWTEAVEPGRSLKVVAGFRNIGRDDQELVNAYGAGGKVITAKVETLPVEPRKFDTFEVEGEVYVVQAVHPVHLNAELIGYRMYARGR